MLGFGLDFKTTIKTVDRTAPDPYAMDNYVLYRHELLPKLEFESLAVDSIGNNGRYGCNVQPYLQLINQKLCCLRYT